MMDSKIKKNSMAAHLKTFQNPVSPTKDIRRESLKASIHLKQAHLFTYSSMSTKMGQS